MGRDGSYRCTRLALGEAEAKDAHGTARRAACWGKSLILARCSRSRCALHRLASYTSPLNPRDAHRGLQLVRPSCPASPLSNAARLTVGHYPGWQMSQDNLGLCALAPMVDATYPHVEHAGGTPRARQRMHLGHSCC